MGSEIQYSEREQQVIELLIQGKSNKQIALALGISQRTVEFHLSNIYAKLDVTSRTEAAVKLSKTGLRESTGEELRESTGNEMHESDDNSKTSISTRRIPVNKSSLIGIGILIATSIFFVGSLYTMATERAAAHDEVPSVTSSPTATVAAPTETLAPTISPKEHILEQIRQLAAEYEQAIQAEKKTGNVEFSKDPNTGDEIFLFKGQSYERIEQLLIQLSDRINQNEQLYNQMYRDETNPTPFPTQLSTEASKAYYDSLNQQVQDYCPQSYEGTEKVADIYNPDDGKYHPLYINDSSARCYLYGKMVEEWRTAPLLAKVNKDADVALIRQIIGQSDLQLTFQSVSGVPNAPWQSAALYTDETGAKYYVDIDTARLAAIEPNFQSHPNIPANEKKSMDELRGIARQFVSTNSPRLAELESVLLYEENCKGAFCFFRWDYRNNDWSGTDWVMMPPFLQVGVLTSGQIVTYIDTLDLFK